MKSRMRERIASPLSISGCPVAWVCLGEPVIIFRRAKGRKIIRAAADIAVALVAAKHDAVPAGAVDCVFRREKLLQIPEGQHHLFVLNAVRAFIEAGMQHAEDDGEIERLRALPAWPLVRLL